MPSPFPGMDPYLEAPDLFPDFHHRLATELSSVLNESLPRPYYAQLEMRPELGILADGEGDGDRRRRIIPDVLVLKHREPGPSGEGGGVAVAEPITRAETAAVEFGSLPDEPARHYTVEIRDATRGHELITLIEILSPTNKRPGPDRDTYVAKQREILGSRTNLVEIDLLRSGRRVLPTPELEAGLARIVPTPDYLVLVSRSWMRSEPMWGYRVDPATLRDWLPCLTVPLRADDEPRAPRLDLQAVFRRAYDGGPYRRGAVDYARPPDPPLAPDDSTWADALLRDHGHRPTT